MVLLDAVAAGLVDGVMLLRRSRRARLVCFQQPPQNLWPGRVGSNNLWQLLHVPLVGDRAAHFSEEIADSVEDGSAFLAISLLSTRAMTSLMDFR